MTRDVLLDRTDAIYLLDLVRRIDAAATAWPDDAGDRYRFGSELYAEARALLADVPPAVHIEWGTRAICDFTALPSIQWPEGVRGVPMWDLIEQRPKRSPIDGVEFVARPPADWGGVTCKDCQARLPTLLTELAGVMKEMSDGLIAGVRKKLGGA